MKIKCIKFMDAIVLPGTAAGATSLIRADGQFTLSYNEKLGAFCIQGKEECVYVAWGNIAYVKVDTSKQ